MDSEDLAQKRSGNTRPTSEKNKYRAYCLTINNPTEDDIETINGDEAQYCVWQMEMGEEGTKHIQAFIYYKHQRVVPKKKYPRAHIEVSRNIAKSIAYCKKNETRIDGPFERGEMPKQGERNDLEKMRNELIENKVKVDEIVLTNPLQYHKYGRTLNAIQDIVNRQKFRTEMTKGIWYFGETGCGKSLKAFENYHPDTHYVHDENDKGWWDNYTGQDIVILDDFRGKLDFATLLTLMDRNPKTVPRRGRAPQPFISKLIIITSSLPPEEVYKKTLSKLDNVNQLYRRCEIVKLKHRDS